MSRAKGNRLERAVALKVQAADGDCLTFGHLASEAGRVGHLDLGADIFSRRHAWECKNREDISQRLWEWLDHISAPNHVPALIVKRNRRRPLVVLDLDDYLSLLKELP